MKFWSEGWEAYPYTLGSPWKFTSPKQPLRAIPWSRKWGCGEVDSFNCQSLELWRIFEWVKPSFIGVDRDMMGHNSQVDWPGTKYLFESMTHELIFEILIIRSDLRVRPSPTKIVRPPSPTMRAVSVQLSELSKPFKSALRTDQLVKEIVHVKLNLNYKFLLKILFYFISPKGPTLLSNQGQRNCILMALQKLQKTLNFYVRFMLFHYYYYFFFIT